MPNLSRSELVVRANAPFGRASTNPIARRVSELQVAERRAAQEAAKVATQTSRATFHYLREPISGLHRNKRSSTGGRFAEHIEWVPDRTGVELDMAKLDQAEHWPILEIGTGHSAKMRWGGDETPGTGARAAELRTVKSQRGRRIHGSLVFGTGPGGQYSPPGASRTQQLFFRDQLSGVPHRRREIRIRKEIKGQHFIKKGAQAGFRLYRRELVAAARRQFGKGNPQ